MRDVDERSQPGEVEVWADTTKFHPRRRLRVDKARGWRRTPERRLELFDEAVRAIGERVEEAVAERSHLRVQGALWSFSAVAATSDVTMETLGRLSQVLDVAGPYPETDPSDPGPLSRALHPQRKVDDGKAYFFVEGGTKMSGVLGALDDLDLSVETAGSSSGQSIAGFLATGSHGPDFDMSPMADYVRALVLVGPDGKARWVERQSEPLVIDEAAVRAELLPSCVELVRDDDDAFDAAVVSLGALGVVAGLVLQVRKQYGLWERVERSEEGGPIVTWEDRKAQVRNGDIFTAIHPEGRYRSLELLINPYPKGGKHYLHIVRRHEHARYSERSFHRSGAPYLAIAHALLSNDPGRFQRVTEKLLRAGREDSKKAYSSHRIIDYGDTRLERTWSAEICVTTKDGHHVDFIDEVLARFDARVARGELLAGFLASRFTSPTRAPLGLETGTHRTCHVELHISQGLLPMWDEDDPEKEGEKFFADFVEVGAKFHAAGHARFHWGQQHGSMDHLTPNAATHPDLARWRAGRDRLLKDGWPYAFANELVVQTGLLAMPAGFELDGYLRTPEGERLPKAQRVRLGASPIVLALPVSAGEAPSLFACNAHGAVSLRDAAARSWKPIDREIDEHDAPDGPIAAATRSDGRRVLVCRDQGDHLRARHETAAGWTGWQEIDDKLIGDPVVAADAHGTLFVFALRDEGALHRWKQSGDGWTHAGAFARPGGEHIVGAPAVVLFDGCLHVVARATDGHLHRARESEPSQWTSLGPAVAGAPAAAVDSNAVFVVAPLADGRLFAGCYDAGWTNGQTSLSNDAHAVLGGTRVSVVARGGKWVVAHTDRAGRARLHEVDGVTWSGVGHEADAVSAPIVLGDRLLIKVAHDIVVSRSID